MPQAQPSTDRSVESELDIPGLARVRYGEEVVVTLPTDDGPDKYLKTLQLIPIDDIVIDDQAREEEQTVELDEVDRLVAPLEIGKNAAAVAALKKVILEAKEPPKEDDDLDTVQRLIPAPLKPKLRPRPHQTLDYVETADRLIRRRPSRVVPPPSGAIFDSDFVPDDEELRSRYLLAEAVGGYETLHDFLNVYSPGLNLARRYADKVEFNALARAEVCEIEAYQATVRSSLDCAHEYLTQHTLEGFSAEEVHELHDLLTLAAQRDKEITRILGAHLIHEVRHAVLRLNEFSIKIHSVERTFTGIFLVDSEVMFIPPEELIDCVNTIFDAVGNAYFAKNVDGVLLLAARNLLIEVVAFFSYYGKHQIYNLFQRSGSSLNIAAITFRIRSEIRSLFTACKQDNRLVLTRVMQDAERDFEISIEAIQCEAEINAVREVERIMPPPISANPAKKTLLQRLMAWMLR
ncbi:MAG: hypothetical protein K0U93_19770 [Gammaproteobacteria bacterium]|nr:hypothetical protein [Gammaproteobacteria bacterium]